MSNYGLFCLWSFQTFGEYEYEIKKIWKNKRKKVWIWEKRESVG